MKYREIGERFEYDGVMLEVMGEELSFSCEGCYFYQIDKYGKCITSEKYCEGYFREDSKSIIYKKVGEMNKPIFENEEECIMVIQGFFNECKVGDSICDYARKKGYIKQSALEEARKRYEDVKLGYRIVPGNVKERSENYIAELEKRIKELEGGRV